MPCNATRIFRHWGILEAVESHSVRPSAIVLKRYQDGTTLSTQNLTPHAEVTYKVPYLLIHRADLVRVLADEALRSGVTIHFGITISKISTQKPSILLNNGVEHQADIVLGADGLYSTCRSTLLKQNKPPYPSGDMAYRFTVEMDNIMQDKDLRDLLNGLPVICWMGPNAHALCYQLKQGGLCNVVLLCPDNLKVAAVVSKADVQEMRERFKDWDPRLRKLIDLADGALKWRLEITEPLNTWSNLSGKFLLIGDACHPTLPYL